jgi:hypothetical protein
LNSILLTLIAWGAAPLMPIDPGDPLEIDETNRMLLEDINKHPSVSSALKEHTRPFETGFALLAAVLFAVGVELFRRKLNEKESVHRISPVDYKRLFMEAKKIKGKASLDILHFLSQDPAGAFAKELDHYRFQKQEPDPELVEAFLQKASSLFDGNNHPT